MHVHHAKTKTTTPQAPPSSEAQEGAPNPITASTESAPTSPYHNYHCHHLHRNGGGLTTPPPQPHQHKHHHSITTTPTLGIKDPLWKQRPPTNGTGNNTTASRLPLSLTLRGLWACAAKPLDIIRRPLVLGQGCQACEDICSPSVPFTRGPKSLQFVLGRSTSPFLF